MGIPSRIKLLYVKIPKLFVSKIWSFVKRFCSRPILPFFKAGCNHNFLFSYWINFGKFLRLKHKQREVFLQSKTYINVQLITNLLNFGWKNSIWDFWVRNPAPNWQLKHDRVWKASWMKQYYESYLLIQLVGTNKSHTSY